VYETLKTTKRAQNTSRSMEVKYIIHMSCIALVGKPQRSPLNKGMVGKILKWILGKPFVEMFSHAFSCINHARTGRIS
jgi:hypothetical protein